MFQRMRARASIHLATFLAAAVVMMSSCDPGVGESFAISPPAPPVSSDVDVREGIARRLADRYGLSQRPTTQPEDLAWYFAAVDSEGRGTLGQELHFLVRNSDDGVIEVSVWEAITITWSSKGDSLRQELLDTLHAHFPSRLQRF